MSLTQVTPDVISTNTISGLISQGFTSMNVATFGTQTIEFGSSNTLVFQANTSLERMRIAANGDIGIGTTTPNSRLTINKNSGSPATIAGSPYFNIVGANADSPRLQFDAYGTGALTLIVFRKANGTLASPSALNSGDQIGNISAWGYGATGYSTTNRGYISFFADEAWTDSAQGTRIVFATATAGAASPGVERMRITANGNVGIGTTTPTQKLEVTGSIKLNSGVVIGERGTAAAPAYSFSDDTDTGMFNISNADLGFSVGGTERVRIDSSGNVGIGTTSPTATLDVIHSNGGSARIRGVSTDGARLQFFNNSATTNGFHIGQGFSTGTDNVAYLSNQANADMIFRTNATERMRITAGGVLCVGGSSSIGSGTGGISSTVSSSYNISLEKPTGGAIGFYQSGVNTSAIEDVSSQGGLRFYTGTGGSITERMRILPGAAILCLSGGNTSATGTGITFPATQNASADANTLDDYEEGSWTPSYSPSGSAFSSIAYSADTTGRYIKIGKMVYVLFWIRITSISGGSGTVRLTGFPFTPENISNLNPGTVVHLASGWGTYTPFSIDYSTGTNFNLKYRASVSGALDPGDINVTDLAANCFMRGSFCYQTSA